MPRKANDGRGRLGGRTVGTPNKPLTPVSDWIDELVNHNRRYIERQLLETPFTPTGTNLLTALIIAAAIKDTAKQLLTVEEIAEE